MFSSYIYSFIQFIQFIQFIYSYLYYAKLFSNSFYFYLTHFIHEIFFLYYNSLIFLENRLCCYLFLFLYIILERFYLSSLVVSIMWYFHHCFSCFFLISSRFSNFGFFVSVFLLVYLYFVSPFLRFLELFLPFPDFGFCFWRLYSLHNFTFFKYIDEEQK